MKNLKILLLLVFFFKITLPAISVSISPSTPLTLPKTSLPPITNTTPTRPPICGLYYIHPIHKKRASLPLKDITYNVYIEEAIARVELVQHYYNNQDSTIHTEYNFPVSDNAVFDKFSAKIGEKVIVGEIKKKEEAKKIFNDQKAMGNTVAYSEITSGVDVMKIQIGNLLAKQEIEIKFSYLEQLEVAINKFWRFRIYSTLVPRYTPINSTQKAPSISTTSENAYPWYVNVDIKSKNKITNIKAPSYKEAIITSESDYVKKVNFDSSVKVYPKKDYELYYETENQFTPQAVLEKHPKIDNSYVGLLEFFPTFNNFSDELAFRYLDDISNGKEFIPEVIANDEKYSKSEFLFILDRSGSMGGTRIERLKLTMEKLLGILPKDSLFNIYNFGSQFNTFYVTSQNVGAMRVDAQTKVKTILSNMGGTNIYEPIKAAINSPIVSESPKIIFLLTDGSVGNSDQIIKLVKDNTDRARTFTVGIGNGISNYFIKNVGLQGMGGYEYVKDSDNLEEKVKFMLYKMISPYLNNFKISFSPSDNISQTRPEIKKVSFLAKNEPFKFFFILDAKKFNASNEVKISVSYYSSYLGKNEVHEFSVRKDSFLSTDRLHKLAYKAIIGDNKWSKKYTDNQIIDLSLKYQVLCNLTAFIVVIQKNDPTEQDKKINQTVNIPNLQSADYVAGGAQSNMALVPPTAASTSLSLTKSAAVGSASPAGSPSPPPPAPLIDASSVNAKGGSRFSTSSNYLQLSLIWLLLMTITLLFSL